jgi:hypothetical protein
MNSHNSDNEPDDLIGQLGRAERDRRRSAAQPDWQALQLAISNAVAQHPVPRASWWRRWLLPTTGLATVAAALAIWINAGSVGKVAPIFTALAIDAAPSKVALVDQPPAAPVDVADTTELSADQLFMADDGDDSAFDDQSSDFMQHQNQAALMGEYDIHVDDENDQDGSLGPDTGLRWIDDMDDQRLDALEQWLSQELAKRQAKKG